MSSEGLARYQVMDPLGEGGQGSTFRGIDRATNRDVAIKVLSLKKKRDWKAFDLFEREVKVLAALDHPALPKYIDSFASEETGDFFVVMTLVEGMPLSRHIEEGRRLAPGRLRQLLEDGLSILEYLHGLSPPVVHRDIKPANLLLSSDGRLSLVDFGGVRRATGAGGGSTVIGTFGYMAPEQLHGGATQAVDIYALGATIAALHAGKEADELPHDGLRLDVESLELPEPLGDVVGKMVEPDPRLRPATVAEVRELLEKKRPKRLAPAPPEAPDSELPAQRPQVRALGTTSSDAIVPMRDVPAPMRAVARAPFPVSVFVWIVAALASGTLVLFEVALLPLIAIVAFAINDRSKSPEKREQLEANINELRDTVTSTRRAFGWVAATTSPVRDRDRALPPADR